MNELTEYVDRRTLLTEVWRTSPSNLYRKMNQSVDPFPRGRLIGGKRYWDRIHEALPWLARQDNTALPETNAEDPMSDAAAASTETMA